MGILVFPQSVNLLCGHGKVTIIVACRSVKCGICGFVTPLAAEHNMHPTSGEFTISEVLEKPVNLAAKFIKLYPPTCG